MPGSPATSPNYALPRFANTDTADFGADVDALVDAIDTNILGLHWVYRTLASGTGTAVSGDFWTAAGGSTVSLPAPTAGRSVAVQADSSASGSSQVTVSTGSGSIRGLGLGTVAASMKLGTPGASVLLVADGTNWRIVAGQQDTGWVALTLSGCTGLGYTPSARLQGDVVRLKGTLVASGTISNGVTWATIASGLRPGTSVSSAVPFAASSAAISTITTAGALSVGTGAGISTTVSLDGLTFSTS